jgi:DUF917 family protein
MSWELTRDDLPALAIGAAILGTGGGGDPYIGRMMAESAMASQKSITVLSVDDLSDDQWVIPVAGMGAPTVLFEKPPRGTEPLQAFQRLRDYLGAPDALPCPIEAGGINSMVPLQVAALLKCPVVDADGMGRAFPELYMQTFHLNGIQGTPACLASEWGETVLLESLRDNYTFEWIARGVTIRLGGHSFVAQFPMQGAAVKRAAIRGTLSLGIRLGRAVVEAARSHQDPLAALAKASDYAGYGEGIIAFRGKIVAVTRRTTDGFARGEVVLEGLGDQRGTTARIAFQNENLVFYRDGEAVAMVPDLITVVDSQTGQAITTERLQYGQRVGVLVIPAPAVMKSDAALKVWGPSAFGYDIPYREPLTAMS